MEKQAKEQNIADRVCKQRTRKGLTQLQLARKTDISYSLIAKLEQGRIKNPSVDAIARIALALGVTIDSLVYGEDEQEVPNVKEVMAKATEE